MFAVCVIMRILPLRRRRLPQTRSRYLVHAAVLSSIIAVLDLAKNRRPSSVCLQLRLRSQRRKDREQALRCTFTKALSEATSGASRLHAVVYCGGRTVNRPYAVLSRKPLAKRRPERAGRGQLAPQGRLAPSGRKLSLVAFVPYSEGVHGPDAA